MNTPTDLTPLNRIYLVTVVAVLVVFVLQGMF